MLDNPDLTSPAQTTSLAQWTALCACVGAGAYGGYKLHALYSGVSPQVVIPDKTPQTVLSPDISPTPHKEILETPVNEADNYDVLLNKCVHKDAVGENSIEIITIKNDIAPVTNNTPKTFWTIQPKNESPLTTDDILEQCANPTSTCQHTIVRKEEFLRRTYANGTHEDVRAKPIVPTVLSRIKEFINSSEKNINDEKSKASVAEEKFFLLTYSNGTQQYLTEQEGNNAQCLVDSTLTTPIGPDAIKITIIVASFGLAAVAWLTSVIFGF
jgi:hypothetical protein